ncbi:MAG: prepilin peptidase [Lachnospiraceae bacterium]|nr:prepilin peptidase [Lachnospiraceae bacterium]
MALPLIYILLLVLGLALGLAASWYSGYRVALGPEEDENDPKEIRKTYKWKLVSKESWIIPVSAMSWLALGLVLLKDGVTTDAVIRIGLYAPAATMLVGLSYVDIMIFEIPPLYDILIAVLGVVRLITDFSHWYEYLIGGILVSGIFLLIALLSKGRAMGGGDIKLTAAMGLLLGWKGIFLVMAIGSLMGAVIHGIIMAVSKKEHVLAFGPYLAAAGVIVMCAGDKLVQMYMDYVNSVMK